MYMYDIHLHSPMTPNCCGERGAASPPPEPIDPDARESRSLNPSGLLLPPLLAMDPIPKRAKYNFNKLIV